MRETLNHTTKIRQLPKRAPIHLQSCLMNPNNQRFGTTTTKEDPWQRGVQEETRFHMGQNSTELQQQKHHSGAADQIPATRKGIGRRQEELELVYWNTYLIGNKNNELRILLEEGRCHARNYEYPTRRYTGLITQQLKEEEEPYFSRPTICWMLFISGTSLVVNVLLNSASTATNAIHYGFPSSYSSPSRTMLFTKI